MNRLFLMLCVLMVLTCSCKGQTEDTDFKIITNRVAHDIMEHPADSVVLDIISGMSEDGIWSDVDYQSTALYNWSPKLHIYRLFTLSSAYIDEKSSYYKKPEILSKIIKGLYKWIELKPVSSNWFVKSIQEPLKIGGVLVLLDSASEDIPSDLKASMLTLLHDSAETPNDYDDFNRTSVAEYWIYRACVEKDSETLSVAVNSIFDLQKINSGGDGYQIDGSFFHGGPQFYIGSYCSGAITTVINTAKWVQGTEYELSQEQLAVLRNFMTNTYPSCVRRQIINYDCVGRAVTECGSLNAEAFVLFYDRMRSLDSCYADLYEQAEVEIKSNSIKPKHNHFWIGDYTTYTCPSFNFSVGLCSTRSMKPEYGLSGNLKGYFLSDGNTCLTVSGQEYYDIAPVWNWNFIPGVTAPILDEIPLQKTAFGSYGTSVFAGGVTDSLYGATAYMYYDDYIGINTGANKGYFFFDNEIVCLGANIRSDHQAITTVEQCWGSNDIDVLYEDQDNNGFHHIFGDVKFESHVSCVIHNGVAYYFPNKRTNVNCQNLVSVGNWNVIDTSQKDTTIAGRVFLMAIKHEMINNRANNYAYIIVPGMNSEKMINYIDKADVEILVNTDSIQSVRHKSLGITELIFYKSCTYRQSELEITASSPCLLIYKYNEKGDPIVYVADPSQKGQDIFLDIFDKKIGKSFSCTVTYHDMPKDYWGITKVAHLIENSSANNKPLIMMRSGNSLEIACNGRGFVYDLNGKLVMSLASDKRGRLKMCLNHKGFYILRTVCGNGMESYRFLVR